MALCCWETHLCISLHTSTSSKSPFSEAWCWVSKVKLCLCSCVPVCIFGICAFREIQYKRALSEIWRCMSKVKTQPFSIALWKNNYIFIKKVLCACRAIQPCVCVCMCGQKHVVRRFTERMLSWSSDDHGFTEQTSQNPLNRFQCGDKNGDKWRDKGKIMLWQVASGDKKGDKGEITSWQDEILWKPIRTPTIWKRNHAWEIDDILARSTGH